ncbi:sugar ABC transporter ATP-binding protein [Paludibacterium yongneupense]|uniref:sugar ABC transporter ATP-binding protein n=1 Tax=Paludibacterium yongneupense TaxID=400061 RepID=UPI000426A1B7|nr:sugar ABC transporter ATP-binding protein [Paludibacterium yongneupense]
MPLPTSPSIKHDRFRAAVLEIDRVSKRFGATQALADVSLRVDAGEVVALMGANGAGKSTLVKIIAGVQAPDSGGVRLDGRPSPSSSPRAALSRGIVTVHQATELLGVPEMTVAENLLLGWLCRGALPLVPGRRRLLAAARDVAALIGLDLPLHALFADLSPAQRQLLAVARALADDARVIILDEPTASVSAREAEQLFEVIARLKARGVGVLYISHRLGDLRRIADRAVVLRNGRVVGDYASPLDLDAAVRAMIGHAPAAPALSERHADARRVLEIRQLTLRAGAQPISLDLCAGEVVAITGPLGAGKSRLLRTLFGAEPLRGGSFALDGRAWQPRSVAAAIASGVFMAGEDRWRSSFLPADTLGARIADVIALPHLRRLFPRGSYSRSGIDAIAAAEIERLGIRCQGPDATPDQLSGGNQQKVVLARWQSQPCRVLLLDEPFQGVDVGARADLIAAIRSRRDTATLVAVSDREEALEVADRLFVMREHRLTELRVRREGESVLAALHALESSEDFV